MIELRRDNVFVYICITILVIGSSSAVCEAAITNITATASSLNSPSNGPEKTVDGSGLVSGMHSTDASAMWQSAQESDPWIQYTFDGLYDLESMHVWNHNTMFEGLMGFGIQEALVEYSTDGLNWTTFGTELFSQGTAQDTYTGFDVSLTDVTAQSVRITALSAFGSLGTAGLSEVQFEGEPADTGSTPTVPVPGAFLLASLGAGAVTWMRRRRTL